jgi:hypothetical protein
MMHRLDQRSRHGAGWRWLLAAVLLVLTGWSDGEASPAAARCAHQLSYWALEALRSSKDTGLDYQAMGLSGQQYEALRALLEQARRPGVRPTPDWVETRAKTACAKLPRSPATSRAPGWP